MIPSKNIDFYGDRTPKHLHLNSNFGGICADNCLTGILTFIKNRFEMFRLFVFLMIANTAQAQFTLYPTNAIPVNHGNGTAMKSAWAGGLNAVQISKIDADGDGVNDDIFVFDKAGNRILLFTAETINGSLAYFFRPELATNFPTITDWALLRDFNCDGKMDLFTYSPNGGAFAVYKNISTPNSGPTFELETIVIPSLYQFSTTSFVTNIYVSSQDIPGIVDFDGDGDLDILTFTVGGSTIEFHENLSMDVNGTCGMDTLVLRNICYGQFSEGLESNNITLGNPCSFNVINPKSGDGSGSRHVGSTILTFDANQDGLHEIVLGDVTYTNLTMLTNSHGILGKDSMVLAETDFPASLGGPAVNLDNFPGGFYEDITGNGIRDLLVGVNNPFLSKNDNSVWYYENLGSNDAPLFSFLETDFLQNDMIEHGEGSAPAFFDFNGNGLKDMVIGTRGRFLGGSDFHQTLVLYVNVGSATNPVFQLEDDDWLNISAIGIGQYAHPTFGDIDGDGDTDMLVGDASGRVFLFENTAGPGNPANFSLAGPISAGGSEINVGQNGTPQLFDLNQNGKLDLIIGERNGNLNFYRNDGTNQNFSFTLVTDTLGGLSTVEPFYFTGSSSPHFYRFDGVTYLLLGAESGRLHKYTNIDGNIEGDYSLETLNAFGAKLGAKSRPSFEDLDGNGIPELFIGGIGGGVALFADEDIVSTNTVDQKQSKLTLFPNPAESHIHLQLESAPGSNIEYRIYSISGVLLLQGHSAEGTIDISRLAQGAYILDAEIGSVRERKLWIKK